jgi:hypothetical protein
MKYLRFYWLWEVIEITRLVETGNLSGILSLLSNLENSQIEIYYDKGALWNLLSKQ